MTRQRQNQIKQNEDQNLEMFSSLTDFITQYGSGASLNDINTKDFYKLLNNPYKNIKSVRKTAKYLVNKHGILKDVCEMFRNFPTLNYHLVWENYDDVKKIQKYEKKIYDFIDTINIKQVVRDGMYEMAEVGTVVCVLRSNKYIQFLDLDDIRMNTQTDGLWNVQYDLLRVKHWMTTYNLDREAIIVSLPDEITAQAYDNFLQRGHDYRFVTIKNAYVLKMRGNRNFPEGLPYHFSAWGAILHKELMDKVERSVADRLIKQILILSVGSIASSKDGYKAPSKDQVSRYFNDLSSLIQRKDSNDNRGRTNDDISGTGIVTLPDFFTLKSVEVDTQLFPKDVYDKVQNDIYADLGLGSSGSGKTENYGTLSVNGEKFYTYIFSGLESWEYMINKYIEKFCPSTNRAKIIFDRSTIFDKEIHAKLAMDLYLQGRGSWIYWVESATGLDYRSYLSMCKYENKVLNLEEELPIHLTSYTATDDSNKPANKDGTTKNNNGNGQPSPSDGKKSKTDNSKKSGSK